MAKREVPQPLPDIRLNPEDRSFLVEIEANLAALDREIKKAEECEFDVTELKASYEKLKRQREKVLRVYG